MKKAVAIASILLVIVACAEQPAYRQADPAMDAIVAGATQTAVAVLLNETAVAQEATRQAIIYQATQMAQQTRTSYEATVQAVQAQQATAAAIVAQQTAVAATATAQRQNEIDALVGEENRIALIALGTRQAVESAATATAVHRDIEDDLAKRRRWSVAKNVGVGGFVLFLLGLGYEILRRIHKGAQAFYNDSGQVVAVEKAFGGVLVFPIRQAITANATVIDGDPQPPINNLPRLQAPREIPGMVGGQPRTFAVAQDDEVRPETWRALAVALLVHCANFSRNGVLENINRAGWQWGSISQPEYNKAFQFMEKNGYLKPGKGAENNLTDKGYDWLLRWIPNSLTITLPYPEETAANLLTR